MQGSSVLEAVESLRLHGMVRKTQGNAFAKNSFGLVYDPDLFKCQERPPQGDKPTKGAGEELTHPKDEKSTDPKGEKDAHYQESSLNSLSTKISSIKSEKIQAGEEEIQKFMKGLGKAGRGAAQKKIDELIRAHSRASFAEAFWFIRHNGTLGTREHCNFPLNYLATAMVGVLEASGNDTQHRAVREHINQSLGIQRASEEAAKREEAEYWAKMEKLFEQAFSDHSAKEAFLAKIQRQFPQCDLNGRIVRSAAVQAWAAERSLN